MNTTNNLVTVPFLPNKCDYSNETIRTTQIDASQEALLSSNILNISTNSKIDEINETVYMCRICHSEEKLNSSDQLITPCKCNGSLNFVHQTCLQKWLQITGSKSCELCNFDFELVKKCKPLKNWQHLELSRSEKTKIILTIILYLIAIVINSWSFSTFWNITVFYIRNNRFNWTFLTIILVLSSSFVCILSFVIFLLQIFYNLFKRFREHNRYLLIKSIKKDLII